MADVKWIKITTDIFDDEKILLIESLPESDSIIVIWFKLLCLAGKTNNSGVFLMNDSIAYTDEMLATIFRRKESTVKMALDTFEHFGMIERVDGVLTIPNWGKHQTLDRLEKKQEYQREYMRDYRAKQKKLADKSDCKTNCKTNSEANVSPLDIEEDKDIDREKEYILLDSKESNCRTEVQRCVDAWNGLEKFGIKKVSRLTNSSQRYQMLSKRIKEYGVKSVLEAIENVKNSDFLQGKTSKRAEWFDFEWFVRPNNFPKVLEGKYNNQEEANETETSSSGRKWQ